MNDNIVGVSFISAEDLERTHAPNGIFRDPKAELLRPSTAGSMSHMSNSSDRPDHRPPSSGIASQRSANSLDLKIEANLQPDSPSKKSSSFRGLFRKGTSGSTTTRQFIPRLRRSYMLTASQFLLRLLPLAPVPQMVISVRAAKIAPSLALTTIS